MAKITVNLNEELLEKLHKSLELQNESVDTAFTKFAEGYISTAYQKLQEYINALSFDIKPNATQKLASSYVNNDFKGVRRIPGWARKPNQYNHRIIRAFLQLEKELSTITAEDLAKRCFDKEKHPETYVPTFSTNFAQMKFDEGKSHGKIFEERYGVVTIWAKARTAIEDNRQYFE